MPPISYFFWLILAIWFVFGLFTYSPETRNVTIGNGVIFVLFVLLGLMCAK